MSNIAVVGATGTLGSRRVSQLERRGIEPVAISRSTGVDLLGEAAVRESLAGVEVVIDTSNAFPPTKTATCATRSPRPRVIWCRRG